MEIDDCYNFCILQTFGEVLHSFPMADDGFARVDIRQCLFPLYFYFELDHEARSSKELKENVLAPSASERLDSYASVLGEHSIEENEESGE